MIVNNYNNSLPENKECDLTFYSLVCPFVAVRNFDFNLEVGSSHLIVPYYVSDSDQKEYRDGVLQPTFTTIFTIDDDTKPNPQVFRRTTYAGEQAIDLGVFNEAGVHTFTVRTIQSNGVGSGTKYYRFIVRDTSNSGTLDMRTTDSFESTFNGYFKYDWTHKDANYIPVQAEYKAKYDVDKVFDDGELVGIHISVSALGNNIPTYARYGYNDYGVRGSYDYNDVIDISGEYEIATRCVATINGESTTVQLSDYLDTPVDELPQEVIVAAARNKVALTRLFEAAKAYAEGNGNGNNLTFVMPQMDIVVAYHNRNGEIYKDSTVGQPGRDDEIWGRDDIRLPDGITIDLNGSSIRALKTSRINGGRIIHLYNNFDTHLVNGNLVGNWHHYQFSADSESESLHMISAHSCRFCTLERLDISWSLGYELHVGNPKASVAIATSNKVNGKDKTEMIPFCRRGYIDYNGEIHNFDNEENLVDTDSAAQSLCYTAPCETSTEDGLCKIRNHGTFLYGNEFRIMHYNTGTEDIYHRSPCREMFVHFYDMNGNFIKTTKIVEFWPVLIPYGAWKMRMTAFGCPKPNVEKSLNEKHWSNSANVWRFNGLYTRSFDNLSWCSGIYDCKVHDTRTCTLDNGGVMTVAKNCKFWNIAAERNGKANGYDSIPGSDMYYISKMLCDFEDDSQRLYNMCLDGCELLFGDVRGMSFKYGYDTEIRNCHNLHLEPYHDVDGMLIENSAVSFTRHNNYKCVNPRTIIRNSLINSISSALSGSATRGAANGKLWLRHCVVDVYSDGEDRIYDNKSINIE